MMRILTAAVLTIVAVLGGRAGAEGLLNSNSGSVLTGKAAYGDWRSDAPGTRRHIREFDLPQPYATRSASNTVTVVKNRAMPG